MSLRKFLFVLLPILFILLLLSAYFLIRKAAINNNEYLFLYEEYTPISYTLESSITYYEYTFDNCKVICSYEPNKTTVLRDNKRAVVKEYYNNVLRSVIDLRSNNILLFFSIHRPLPDFIRTDEECEAISKMLEQKDYDTIEKEWNGKIVTTTSGTVYVN